MAHTLQHALASIFDNLQNPFPQSIFFSLVAEDEKEVLMGHAEEKEQLAMRRRKIVDFWPMSNDAL